MGRAPVARRARQVQWQEPVEPQAVVDEVDRTAGRAQCLQPAEARARACHYPSRAPELLGKVPVGRGPDVLGVGRTGPGQVEDGGRVGHDAGGRVDEMGVQPAHVGRQFGRQHERLPHPPQPVGRTVAREVGAEAAPGQRHAGTPSHPPPRGQHAPGRLVEVLGQVADGRPDGAVDGVQGRVGRAPQGHDPQVEARLFEPQDLLGDEGFRQPGIALQHERDGFPHASPEPDSSVRAGPSRATM